MTELWRFTLLGLGLGGIYALAAQGLVLVYRGSGVLNFAQAAVAAIGAYVCADVHAENVPMSIAVVAGLAASVAVGLGIHLLVMRPLRHASALTRIVATLGLLTAFQGALIGWPFAYGDSQRFVKGFLPKGTVDFGNGVTVSQDRLWLLGIAAVLSAVLWAVYKYTRFGLTTRAVAENEDAAAALGRSPDVVAAVNWMLGSALAGLAGILIVPVIGLSVAQVLSLLVPAVAAALVGGFVSFPLAFAGGVLIGVIESVLTSQADWLPDFLNEPGWPKAVPFLVIIAVLVIGGRPLPLRGHVADRMPKLGDGRIRPWALVAMFAVTWVLVSGAVGGGLPLDWIDALSTTVVSAVICLSLVVVTGYTGQLSLAQYALAGIGAYVAARVSAGADLFGLVSFGTLRFEVAVLVGILLTVPVGVLVGLPALRVRGVNLAIATLGLASLIERVALGNPKYTGGFAGTKVARPQVLGLDLDPLDHPRRYALLCVVMLTVAGLAVANLRRGRSGRRLIAVRTNERAAASLGISVFGAKLYAFGLGAGIAGLGGILLAFRTRTVLFTPFGVMSSIQVVVQTVLGGIGFVCGAVFGGLIAIGGVIPFGLEELLDVDVALVLLLSGVVLVVNLIISADGVVPSMPHVPIPRARWRSAPVAAALPDVEREAVRPQTLTIDHVSVRFGGVVAVDDVTLEIRPGEVLGLIGPNGAGKTTLIDLVTGFAAPAAGEVRLDDAPITGSAASRRARAGVTRSFQSLELFEDMSVRDNLRTASDRRDGVAYLLDLVWPRNPELDGTAVAAIREFALEADLDRKPDELPYGRRRLVGIARAVASRPSVLLLDEPAAGLDSHETAELGDLIRRLAREWGLAVLLVEHDVGLVMSVCDRIVALDFGRVIAEGTPGEIRRDAAVIASYLGGETVEAPPGSEDALTGVTPGATP